MTRYLLRRLAYLIPVLLGISVVTFLLTNLTPGDPARLMLERQLGRQPSPEEVMRTRRELNLDAPIPVRYVRWLSQAVTGNFGVSYGDGEPVLRALARRFVNTFEIAVLGMTMALAIALPLGVLAAIWRNSPLDHLSRVIVLLGTSMPSYWFAYLLILVFAVRLQVLPVAGRGSWQHLVLPSATLGLAATASLMRLTRAEMIEVLGQDYIRTSRAKGLGPGAIYIGHALRNALVPVVTVAGMRFAHLLGGAVIVEAIFAWPGIGKFMLDAIFNRDYPVIQGFVLFMGIVFILINLLVDVSYAWLDPQIRLQ